MGACTDCGHIHTPQGCTGDPTPSDLWAGVSVAGCDCDDLRVPVDGRYIDRLAASVLERAKAGEPQ